MFSDRAPSGLGSSGSTGVLFCCLRFASQISLCVRCSSCLFVCALCACLCSVRMPGACGSPKEASDPLEPKPQAVVSHCVARRQTWSSARAASALQTSLQFQDLVAFERRERKMGIEPLPPTTPPDRRAYATEVEMGGCIYKPIECRRFPEMPISN